MTPHRSRAPLPRLWQLVGLAIVLLALIAVNTPRSEGRVVEIIVPRGTQERLDRGERVSIMPPVLEFRVGDTLRIENRDVVDQPVGPYVVPAGGDLEITYGAPGRYQGICAVSESDSYEIVITE